jgi:hypothetical protein
MRMSFLFLALFVCPVHTLEFACDAAPVILHRVVKRNGIVYDWKVIHTEQVTEEGTMRVMEAMGHDEDGEDADDELL